MADCDVCGKCPCYEHERKTVRVEQPNRDELFGIYASAFAAHDRQRATATARIGPSWQRLCQDAGYRALYEAGRASLGLPESQLATAREIKALRAVAEAAAEFIASRGKIQEKTPLHDALAAYYRTLAAARRAEESERAK